MFEPFIVIVVLLIITSIIVDLYQSLDLFVYVVAVKAMLMSLVTLAWFQLYLLSLVLFLGSASLAGFFFWYRYWRHL